MQVDTHPNHPEGEGVKVFSRMCHLPMQAMSGK